jgi:hypothetical protein
VLAAVGWDVVWCSVMRWRDRIERSLWKRSVVCKILLLCAEIDCFDCPFDLIALSQLFTLFLSSVVFTSDDPIMSVLQVEVTCQVVRPER